MTPDQKPKEWVTAFTVVMVPTVLYSPDMIIRNLESLPRGTGCRYLEVIDGLHGEYVAAAWRRKPPPDLPRTRKLIEFPPAP